MENNNILSLIRLGFLPPDFKATDLKKTIYYILWERFRLVCSFGEIRSLTPPDIFCKKVQMKCDFIYCPIVKNALREYERKNKLL